MNMTTKLYGSLFSVTLVLGASLAGCGGGDDGTGGGGTGGGGSSTSKTVSASSTGSTGSTSSSSSGGSAQPELKFIAQFDPGLTVQELPEGVAVTTDGKTAYVGFAPKGKIVKVSLPDGTVTAFGNIPEPPPLQGFATGIAIDSAGDVYVAGGSLNPAYKAGIHKIPKAGGASSPFFENMDLSLPNGLVFDPIGNLYATDSITGTIYKIKSDKTFVKWSEDPLLKGDTAAGNLCKSGQMFPIGANGIAIVGNDVFVANTDKASIIKIPINGDGTAGTASEFSKSDAMCAPLAGADGLAADTDGTLLLASNGGNALLRIGKDGKATKLIEKDKFDGPASVSVATLPDGKKYAIVTNFALGSFSTPGAVPKPGLLSYGPLP